MRSLLVSKPFSKKKKLVLGVLRKKKRPENSRRKRNVRRDMLRTNKEPARRKIVSSVISRLLRKKKPVWPQPKPNKRPMQRSLHAKKKSADRRSCVIQRSVLSVKDSSVRPWIKKELNLRRKRRLPRTNSLPRRTKCREPDSSRRQRISRDRRS